MSKAMHVTRLAAAPEYRAPGHNAMRCLRIQGMEAGPSTAMWIAISVIEPGGGIDWGASPLEKMYVVLEGSVEITSGGQCMTLDRWDSCRIAPCASRALANRSKEPATVLLAMEIARQNSTGQACPA